MRVPARPVVDRLDDLLDGIVDVLLAQLAGDAGEPRAEDEDFHIVEALLHRMNELEQEAGIAIHRTADVADQHQWAHLHLVAPTAKLDRDAAVLHAVPQACGGSR